MHRGGQRPGVATLRMSKDAIPAPSTEAAAFTAMINNHPFSTFPGSESPKENNQMSLLPNGAMQALVAPGPAAVDRAAGLCRRSGLVQSVPSASATRG